MYILEKLLRVIIMLPPGMILKIIQYKKRDVINNLACVLLAVIGVLTHFPFHMQNVWNIVFLFNLYLRVFGCILRAVY